MKRLKIFGILVVLALAISMMGVLTSCDKVGGPKYDGKQYTVTFVSDGEVVLTQSAVRGSSIAPPENLEKLGYKLARWENEDGMTWDFGKRTVTSDVTLTAVWEKDSTKYKVTFDPNGGELNGRGSENVAIGDCVTVPRDPSRERYDFAGWYLGDKPWNFSTKITENITLTAKWTAKTYYWVSFDVGAAVGIPPIEVEAGYSVSAPDEPTLARYNFGGWYLDGTEWDFSAPVTESITLTAEWLPKTYYYVSFNVGAGSSISPVEVEEGALLPEITSPTLDRYRFAGWYIDDEGTEVEWDAGAPITENITLTAKWIPRVYYTVSFDVGNAYIIDSIEVEELSFVSFPDNPVNMQSNLSFVGWYYNGEEWDPKTQVTENITLTAKWDYLIYDDTTQDLIVVFNSYEFYDDGRYDELDQTWNIVRAIEAATDIEQVGWGEMHHTTEVRHEILFGKVVGDARSNYAGRRELSVTANNYLETRIHREAGMGYFVIYSDGTSVAIAFDSVDDQSVGVAAAQYFIENYVGERLVLEPGLVAVVAVPLN